MVAVACQLLPLLPNLCTACCCHPSSEISGYDDECRRHVCRCPAVTPMRSSCSFGHLKFDHSSDVKCRRHPCSSRGSWQWPPAPPSTAAGWHRSSSLGRGGPMGSMGTPYLPQTWDPSWCPRFWQWRPRPSCLVASTPCWSPQPPGWAPTACPRPPLSHYLSDASTSPRGQHTRQPQLVQESDWPDRLG